MMPIDVIGEVFEFFIRVMKEGCKCHFIVRDARLILWISSCCVDAVMRHLPAICFRGVEARRISLQMVLLPFNICHFLYVIL